VRDSTDNHPAVDGLIAFIAIFLAIALMLVVIMGAWFGVASVHRHQKMATAKNDVQIAILRANNQIELNKIDISSQGQRILVAQQQAQIRKEQAVGVREAQDEIAKTLTPLYVQYEMTDVLRQIAISGKNNTVVYIPSGANGIPLVAGAGGSPTVGITK
jgi:hypothetical protein